MNPARALEGIIPVLVTPLKQDGSIDVDGLERLVAHLTSLEIGGLWVLGTGSEDMNLTYQKRLQVAQVASKANASRVTLILGASFFALEDTLNFMDETADLEVDGYHMMPYHPLYSLERMAWHYKRVADHCSKPLWLYTSGNWCRQIPPSSVLGLKNHPNIAGIKFSSSNATHCGQVIAAQEPGFQVITAVATQLYSCLCWGSRGHTSSIASAIPEPMIDILQKYEARKYDEALSAQRRFNEFLSRMPSSTTKDNFLKAADEKYILSLRGICEPYTSDYYRDASTEERCVIAAALEEFGYIGGAGL